MLKKAYVEITDICNLSCDFCHPTAREPAFVSVEDFSVFARKLRAVTGYLYLHVLGEPLLHPELDKILGCCDGLGFAVTVTTNGTLIKDRAALLLSHTCVYKVCFSLHSFGGNKTDGSIEDYILPALDFAGAASARGIKIGLRLWNGPHGAFNGKIKELVAERFPPPYTPARGGEKIRDGIYFEYGDRFEWPDLDAPVCGPSFCMGLRDQVAVLCDGTVIPCCMDTEGSIKLGDLHRQSIEEILSSERALRIKDGFSRGVAVEELCKRCGFAKKKFG